MYSLQITWPSTALKLELKSGMGVAIYNGLELGLHRKIRLIESNAKCWAELLSCKMTLWQVLYLSEAPPFYDPLLPPPLHTVYMYKVYLFTQGRGGAGAHQRED